VRVICLPRVTDNGGARDSNRTNLFCSSGRRVDHDHYTGAFGAAGGKSNPSSPRWQRGALPLSYGREIGGQGPSRTATDYAGRLQRLGLANAQPARDWLRFEHAFRGYEPRPGPGYRSVIPRQRCEALNSLACRQYIRGRQNLAESRELESQTNGPIRLRGGAGALAG
jgi:hypothetical protein